MSDEVIRSPVNGAVLPPGRRFEQGEKQREIARRGGKASVAKRRAKKAMRDELIDLLMVETEGKDGKKHTTQEGISVALIRKAMNGDTKAYEIIRDTIGEKPVENVKVTNTDSNVMEEIKKRMAADAP